MRANNTTFKACWGLYRAHLLQIRIQIGFWRSNLKQSHNIPGGKQLQRASVLQKEAASTKLPSLLLKVASSGCVLTQ